MKTGPLLTLICAIFVLACVVSADERECLVRRGDGLVTALNVLYTNIGVNVPTEAPSLPPLTEDLMASALAQLRVLVDLAKREPEKIIP